MQSYGRLNRWSWQATRVSRRIRHRLRLAWRRPLARWRALPSFIIIGAQKSGTSSLYAYLASHPRIVKAAWKEVGFFGRRFSKGERWYRAHFPLTHRLEHRNATTGEATPYYLYHPQAAARIARLLPEVRLIALLRDPVNRAISHYWHQVKRGREHLPLEQALAAEEERLGDKPLSQAGARTRYHHYHFAYTGRGLYAPQLKRYGQHFDPAQLLVLRSKDFFENVQSTFDRVTDFLGLQQWTLPEIAPRNTHTYPHTDASIRAKLERFYEPHNQALYDYLDLDEAWW